MSLHRKTQSSINLVIQQPFQQRKWLIRRGKEDRLQFSDQMIRRLKDYFLSLDQDNSATISSNQLEDPLLLFGLCKNKQDVEDVFKYIDFDGSGELEFREFLQVFRRVGAEARDSRLCKRHQAPKRQKYQQFTKTLLGMQSKLQSNVSFRLGMSIYRRKNMLNALISKDAKQRQEGKQILNKFEEQVKGTPSLSRRLIQQKNANLQCLPMLPAKKIQPIKHRRIKTVI